MSLWPNSILVTVKYYAMKKISFILFSMVVACTAAAQCDKEKNDPPGGCPYILNGQRVFDRCAWDLLHNPTAFGNAVCDAITAGIHLGKKFQSSTVNYREEAEKAMAAHLKPLFHNAIDQEALKDYNEAAGFYNQLLAEVKAMVKDKDCGIDQTRNLQRFFTQQLNNIKSATGIIQVGYNVVKKEAPPAMQNTRDFTAAVGEAVAIASNKGGATLDELKKIQTQFAAVSNNLEIIKQFGEVVSNTADLSVNVGGLYGSCAACAASLTTTIAEIETALAAGGVTVSTCPVTFEALGGGCWAAAVAGLEGSAAALTSLLATGACAIMVDQIKDIEEDIKTIVRFGKAIQQSGNKIYASIQIIDESAQRIANLMATAPAELKPALVRMSGSLAGLDANFDNMFNTINNDIIPKVSKFGGSITRQVVTNVTALHNCYLEYSSLAERITTETTTGIRDMFTAGTRIVNAAQVMDNAGQGAAAAINAAKKKAGDEYDALKGDWNRMMSRFPVVWKNGAIDVPATAKKFADGLFKTSAEQALANMKGLIDDANKLMASVNKLIEQSISAGDRAYISKPSEKDKAKASAKSEMARAEARSAKEKLYRSTKKYAKEKAIDAAKAEARRKSREKLDAAKNVKVEDMDMSITVRTRSTVNPLAAPVKTAAVTTAPVSTKATGNSTTNKSSAAPLGSSRPSTSLPLKRNN
jgi:hypothetical protein